MTPLAPWQNFYVILGSAAGGLTGLQFIAMALIADISTTPSNVESGEAFATPNIVHFIAVLVLSASMVVPWVALGHAVILWEVAGIAGAAYCLLIARRMHTQSSYKPVLEDWLFRAVLPFCDYLALAISAACLPSHPRGALFGIAASVLVLLVIAIQHAWDNVTYLVFLKHREPVRRR